MPRRRSPQPYMNVRAVPSAPEPKVVARRPQADSVLATSVLIAAKPTRLRKEPSGAADSASAPAAVKPGRAGKQQNVSTVSAGEPAAGQPARRAKPVLPVRTPERTVAPKPPAQPTVLPEPAGANDRPVRARAGAPTERTAPPSQRGAPPRPALQVVGKRSAPARSKKKNSSALMPAPQVYAKLPGGVRDSKRAASSPTPGPKQVRPQPVAPPPTKNGRAQRTLNLSLPHNTNTYDGALLFALHILSGAADTWESLRYTGASDSELEAAVATYFPTYLGYHSERQKGFRIGQKPEPYFVWGNASGVGRCLKGSDLLNKIRTVLRLPNPAHE